MAFVAKEKGNASFKAGDFPTAIGHYTTAILADRNEPTFSLNRAAAYLKLSKYEDAARDCSTVLTLDPSSVKALFRRAQAKVGMDLLLEAQDDYKEALKLEPANESIQLEMKVLGERLERIKLRTGSNAVAGPSQTSTSSVGISPKRRRIPINVVEPANHTLTNKLRAGELKADPTSSNTDLLKPVSSRPLNSPQATNQSSSGPAAATLVPPPAASTFKDAKKGRESAKPSRTGGGIFRQNGNHTVFGARDGSSSTAPQSTSPVPAPKAMTETSQLATIGPSSNKPPMTLFNFMRAWETLSSAEEQWLLLSNIPPSSLPSMFKMSLEPSLLMSLLETFRAILDENQGDIAIKCQVGDYMKALANIPRFNTVWLFLGKTERECAKDVWRKLGVNNPDLWSYSGGLTAAQQESFSTFKANLIKRNLYRSPTSDRIASHDEPTLLRFLRARQYNPEKAEEQFSHTEAWRQKHNVDDLFATFDPVEFEASKRFYPRWTGRRDRDGRPVYVYRLASLAGPLQEELDRVPQERRYQRIVALYEIMSNFVMPLCTHLPHTTSPSPISSTTSIIDLQDVSFVSMWALRKHLQQASTLATANYPETLHTIAVVNSPSFFPTVWGWISNWFDEGTRKKIHVLGKDPGSVLRSMIESSNLPKIYGGELDWKFEDEPILDEPAKGVIGSMPKGPAVFVDGIVRKP